MTIRHRMTVRATVSVLMAAVWVFPGAVRAQEVGPPRGALVIVGGAMRDPAIASYPGGARDGVCDNGSYTSTRS